MDLPSVPELLYRRQGDALRIRCVNFTNHELREVLVGFWARLDPADRAEHINELLHYAPMLETPDRHPDRHLSGVALSIRNAGKTDATVLDLTKIGDDR